MRRSLKILSSVLVMSIIIGVVIYWTRVEDACFRVPLRLLSGSHLFYVDGTVGDRACFLGLHIGGNYEFRLSKRMIESVSFKKAGFATYTYENDREIEEPLYKIPEITIGNLRIKNAIARQDEHDFSPDLPPSDSNRSYRIGEFGSKILDHTNVLLDIPHRCLYFTKSIRQLKREGYDVSSWLVVPFEKAKSGVKIEVETDLGKKSFILFTASTDVLLKSSVINQDGVHSKRFIIKNVDFGPINILSYELPGCPADGLIGLSFLHDRAVYIDYSHQRLYIQR